MNDENDWTRLAMSLDAIREKLLDGTHGVLAESDSVTVLTDTWVATVIELRRAQKQCAAYGEMHCPRVPDMPNAHALAEERSDDSQQRVVGGSES